MNTPEATADRGARRFLPRAMAIAAVALLLGLLAYGLLAKSADMSVDEDLVNGRAPLAPSFDLPVLERGSLSPRLARDLRPALADDRLTLEELRGTPVVLNFWASWCIPCREEAPILDRGWRRHGRRGVLYLGLNMQDLTGDARAFLREFGVEYPTIRDRGSDAARSYGATGIPETYFISPRGRIVGHVIGVVTDEQLDQGAIGAKRGRLVGRQLGGARKPQR